MGVNGGVTRSAIEGALTLLPEESLKQSTFLGAASASALAAKAESNTFYGSGAGEADTTGSFNTALGWGALAKNKVSSGNTAVGNNAGAVCENAANTFLGSEAGFKVTSGGNNVHVGEAAGSGVTTASNVVAIGRKACAESNGEYTVAIGSEAGNVAGIKNVFVGSAAGKETTGEGNIFIGYIAGFSQVAVSNKLIIANNGTTPLISGVLSGTQAIGFYGVAPVARAAHPTTLAEVITLLTNLGLCS